MNLLLTLATQGDGISKNTLEVVLIALLIICAIVFLVTRARR